MILQVLHQLSFLQDKIALPFKVPDRNRHALSGSGIPEDPIPARWRKFRKMGIISFLDVINTETRGVPDPFRMSGHFSKDGP
jgi:hypothetical protein